MTDSGGNVLVQGFFHLVVSQISTRLITFFLNLLTARLLTIDAYGLASVQFHLINTFILFLSREGFRRGCLRAQQSSASPEHITRNVLAIAALSLPLGALTTLCTCGVALRGNTSWADVRAHAIYLQDGLWSISLQHPKHLECRVAAMLKLLSEPLYILAQLRLRLQLPGVAAMLELLSEPLYILAQLRIKLQLRVAAEASATLARGVATLALLKGSPLDVGISLSLAQCVYAAVTLAVYICGMAGELTQLARKGSSGQQKALGSAVKGRVGVHKQQPEAAKQGRHINKASAQDAALTGPQSQADEDEDWEMLTGSASPDSASEQSLVHLSPAEDTCPADQKQHRPEAEGTRSKLQHAGAPSAANESAPPHAEEPSRRTLAHSAAADVAEAGSRSLQEEGVEMQAEMEGKSLLYPRSASTAAQLTEGFQADVIEQPKGHEHASSHRQAVHGKAEEVPASASRKQQDTGAASGPAAAEVFNRGEVLWRCGIFTVQAATKLLLAEGSKVVMVASQSSYNQGIYGLVSNLGSLVVRTIFQPFEEAAFLAFSQHEAGVSKEASSRKQARELSIAVRCVSLVGLLAAAFGPAYTYMLLRLVYGQRWSETEAPRTLAAYCLYILLLAVNGIFEAFVHAVAESRDIASGNGWLVACSLVHMGLAVLLVKPHGALGLIAADSVNMLLRIGFCLVFVAKHFKGIKGFQLRGLFPSGAALSALAAASGVCLAADSVLFGGTALPKDLQEHIVKALWGGRQPFGNLGFMPRAVMHAGIGASTLAVLLRALYRTEGSLVAGIRQMRKQAVS